MESPLSTQLAPGRELRIPLSFALLTVLAIPLFQLLVGPSWMYNPQGFDQWFYHGYFLHLKHHLVALQGMYFGTRLAWILPGFVAHALFSPLAANFALRLYVYWTAILSLYFLVQRSYGQRCAVICCLLLSSCAAFLSSVGWDYIDGAGTAYALLCLEEVTASAMAVSRRAAIWRAVFAGAAFAAALHTTLFLVVLGPGIALIVVARAGKRAFLLALPAFAGAVSLTAILGLINMGIGGPFLFFAPSLTAGASLAKPVQSYGETSRWIHTAWWLVIPSAVSFAALLFVIWMTFRIRTGEEPLQARLVRMADAASSFLLFSIFLALHVAHITIPVLMIPLYSIYLSIFAALAAAALIGRRLDSWSNTGFVIIASAGACLALLVGTDLPAHLPPSIGLAYIQARGVPGDRALLLCAALAGALVLGLLIPHRLASTLVVAAGIGYVLTNLKGACANQGPCISELVGSEKSRAIYLDVNRLTRDLGRLSHEGTLWFWYDYRPAGDDQYTSISGTYLWATTLLGRSLPDPKDARFADLQSGDYIALMDDQEDAVNKALALLRGHGMRISLVQRLQSDVLPDSFGIQLVKVTGRDLPAVIYTSSPSREKVDPGADIINYDADALSKAVSCSTYGKQPANPPHPPSGVYKITDARDHCGIQFQPINAPGSRPVTAVEVTALSPQTDEQLGSVAMIFQDQDYKVLYAAGTLRGGEARALVALPPGTRSVRVAFLANALGFIRIPKAVELRAFTSK